MKTFGMTVLAALGLLAVVPGQSQAATADGTLITNVACATFSANQSGSQGYAVSYCATATVLVQNPCIALQKIANPTVQASGGDVTFTLWVVNCSATSSAWNITVNDRMPDNTEYVNPSFTSWPGLVTSAVWEASYASTMAAAYTVGQPADGQDAPYYLRYVLPWLGPNRSAFARFAVTIL